MRITAAYIASVIGMTSVVDAKASIGEEWADLWERCRFSIEEAVPVSARNLKPLALTDTRSPKAVAPQIVELNGHKIQVAPGLEGPVRVWINQQDTFVLSEYESQAHNKSSYLKCTVHFATEAPKQQAVAELVYRFLLERVILVAEGTHTVAHLQPIHPAAMEGFFLSELNPNERCVISTIVFDAEGYFSTSTGEQYFGSCKAAETGAGKTK